MADSSLSTSATEGTFESPRFGRETFLDRTDMAAATGPDCAARQAHPDPSGRRPEAAWSIREKCPEGNRCSS